ncbi:signal transduction protein [Levilactobacillus tujiorum]|uniref:Signal transduction protein n=1 Tax=Levilactobacillus tujiorum TaxID=2912243 RepID=A0ABX1L2V4_9LACO|nr:signal transduction protein [Levilactobacillus tujiorum]MCH5464043.1 signal transduction protein [Levilactobacillus tujiorum]NLR11145.1 signal transduction protein [Lactobacillus sp. HBUAS51387]NLR29028.1 signal transduction protein [Levilactobacillus tujiorum]
MITVDVVSFGLADFSLVFWFVYFQYYWFPRLRVKKNFLLFCALMGLGFMVVDLLNPFTASSSLLGMLPIIVLLVIEVGMLAAQNNWQLLPAFIDVSILAYLLTEFVDMSVIAGTIRLTSVRFAASVWGTLTELTIDTVIFTMIAMGILLTRAPMENLIHAMLGRSSEYLFLIFMTVIGLVYILFEYSLQSLADSDQYLIFLAGISGTLVIGLTLSTYMLMQTHLQEEHTQLQTQQQAFREQYTTELNRQLGAVRKFSHDYQNMLLGLGGYLEDKDYEGFRQLYIDIRSGWQTSNAAELTVDDLTNIPNAGLRYGLYHNYLLAREQGVQLFVKVPEPLTATVATLKEMVKLVDKTLVPILPEISHVQPAIITLELTETPQMLRLSLTFPVPTDAQVDGKHRVVAKQGMLDFSKLQRSLPQAATSKLTVKFHWGQLVVVLPKG